ncbi:MAG: decarboxylase [Candidatus Omnitrophica bacterium]|nr:decarboxylase [Candidatus Omnitrophota bacterium]
MDEQEYLDKAQEILRIKTPLMDKEALCAFVDKYLKKKNDYLDVCREKGSPLYLFDQLALRSKAQEFYRAFKSRISQVSFFYAMKSNNHPVMIETLVEEGYGIDVSSAEELRCAVKYNPKSVIFSGPGKTDFELEFACHHSKVVTVLLDSFGELDRLQKVACRKDIKIKAGVRLMNEENGLWRKFGVPLDKLDCFFGKAKECSHVELCGLQFHSSWNLDANKQIAFLERLGKAFLQMDKSVVQEIDFVDVGGGYWPAQGEWMQPSSTPEGKLKQCLVPQMSEGMDHRCLPSISIEEFAQDLADALDQHIFKYIDCDIYLEPGRWISHEVMHILLEVIDKKDKDVVVTDGGTNMIGWERFEIDYFPVINLSQPSLEEKPCMVFGSLCTPHDIWGFSYFGKGIEVGDVLMIPTQGSYTYSLRQNFIKLLPKSAVMNNSLIELWSDR